MYGENEIIRQWKKVRMCFKDMSIALLQINLVTGGILSTILSSRQLRSTVMTCGPRNRCSTHSRGRRVSLFCRALAKKTSCTMGKPTACFFPKRVKRLGREADHSLPRTAEIKEPYVPAPYVFMMWGLINQEAIYFSSRFTYGFTPSVMDI